jgi:hypothetical protein
MEESGLDLREVVVFGPGEHDFDPDEWVEAIRVCAIGGDGGDGATGKPGGHGTQVISELYQPEGPLRFLVGRGGTGDSNVEPGQDGSVIVELWGRPV